jgi:DNA recombination protein RmuC
MHRHRHIGLRRAVVQMTLTLVSVLFAALSAALVIVLLRRRGPGSRGLESRLDSLERGQDRLERALREETSRGREESGTAARSLREEITGSVTLLRDSLGRDVGQMAQANEQRLKDMRDTMDVRLQHLQEENNRRLEDMRRTVDEQLQSTLEKRLGDSFRQVSERLEAVHTGLGEMRTLAAGVGDLKRVLTNVKARGTWGEVQLGALLEQVLTPDQYQSNVATRAGASERVEYAIKLPGREDQEGSTVWLPIDAKFPVEDYSRLLDAEERADQAAADIARKQLEARIKASAKDIRDKYLDPPGTTDFGIMFLPTEGLYAEVIRRPGLVETLQCEYRVTVAGPVTLTAILNSLQMGFRTLAIQKRSGEVWQLLGAVKTQFAQFGDTLEKVSSRLHQATDTIDQASRRTRAIERRLRDVEGLPADDAGRLLPETADDERPDGTELSAQEGCSEAEPE